MNNQVKNKKQNWWKGLKPWQKGGITGLAFGTIILLGYFLGIPEWYLATFQIDFPFQVLGWLSWPMTALITSMLGHAEIWYVLAHLFTFALLGVLIGGLYEKFKKN